MPRFMGFVRMEENIGKPPQSLFGAMDAYIGERAANGVFLDGGGLYGTEDAVNFVVRKGEVTRVDGPYAEAKEVVGGWSLLEYALARGGRRRPARSSPGCTPSTGPRSRSSRPCARSPAGPEAPGD